MFNLLPQNLKEKIKKDYKIRRIILILAFVICIQVSFLIFFFPSWLVSLYNQKEVVAQHEDMKKYLADLNVAPAIDSIRSINARLNAINNTLDYPKVVPFFDLIIGNKTPAITLDEFLYTLNSDGTATINIGGISTTREALVSFTKSLEETKSFKDINLPISNLAKDKNIDFTVSMKVSNK